MDDQQTLLRLIELIYDAALDSARWTGFLQEFAEAIDGHTVSISYLDALAPGLAIFSSARFDPDAKRQYEQHFGVIDPWLIEGRRKGTFQGGAFGIGEAIVSKTQFVGTEFYNDFAKHHGIAGGLAGVIRSDENSVAMIAASHSANTIFGDRQLRLLGALMPHLQRGVQLHRRLTRVVAERDTIEDVLHGLPVALVLLSDKGHVVLVNDAARTILAASDGLTIRRNALCAHRGSETTALHRWIAQAVATTNGQGFSAGGAMAVSRPSGKRSFSVLVAPFHSRHPCPPGGARAVVFLTDPDCVEQPEDRVVCQLFGVTPAESRVALLLARGHTFAEVIEMLHITASTGRTHLKNIFSKTGTRTQAQLVRAILTVIPRVPHLSRPSS